MTYKDKLVFFSSWTKIGFKYDEWSLQFTSIQLKRVLYLQKVYMKITILEKIPIGILPQLTKYYT